MINIIIDGDLVEVEEGTTILNAARKLGKHVPPAMCYYTKLHGSGGKCRVCLVKVSKGSAKDPRPMPKLVASCSTLCQDGMEVQNESSEEVSDARKAIVEFLLINHPLDCPVCDQAGECSLQDLSFQHGNGQTRYEFERRTFKKQDIGKYIQLHMTRCILCYRCVHAANQLTPGRVHGVLNRGDVAEIGTYIRNAVENEFSGNMIDVCPVGALTDKTFRFKSRVWFTNPVDAHRECKKCSGKVTLWYQATDVLRVTGRKDKWAEVEDFICNDCRFEKKQTSDWVIEGPRKIAYQSVISQNHYVNSVKPHYTMPKSLEKNENKTEE
jgi:NADH-quinone oxidoreductase subunit G